MEQTSFEDTHPSLQDRLKAIGQKAQFNFAEKGKTSESLLGHRLAEITDVFDHKWQRDVSEFWQQHYQGIQQQKQQLECVMKKTQQNEELSFEEKLDLIDLTDRVAHQPRLAFQYIEKFYVEDSENPLLNFIYGDYLIRNNDGLGVEVLQKAMLMNEFYIIRASEILTQYFQDKCDEDNALKFKKIWIERSELEFNATQEREHLHPSDQILAHNITTKELDELVAQLRKYTDIQKVFFVRKETQYLSHIPCYIMAFSIKKGFGKVDEATLM